MKRIVMSLLLGFFLVAVSLAGLSTNAEAFGFRGDKEAAIMECERDGNSPFSAFIVHLYSHSSGVDNIGVGTDCAAALSTLQKSPNNCKLFGFEYLIRNGERSLAYTLTCK